MLHPSPALVSLPGVPCTNDVLVSSTGRHREFIGPVGFDATTLAAAVDETLTAAVDPGRTEGWSIRLANAYSVVVADSDTAYAQVLNGSGRTFADGAPIEWIMRRRSVAAAGRVRGPSFFKECLRAGQETGVRHFFLGTTEETLAALVAHVSQDYPGAKVAGTWAPPFGPVDDEFVAKALQHIGETDPHIVWVALGTPKQDFASERLAAATGSLCIGVGAAFDFVAQTKAEAPEWMQHAGVEWMFRLASEPRRLARRYLVGNAQFLRIAARGTR